MTVHHVNSCLMFFLLIHSWSSVNTPTYPPLTEDCTPLAGFSSCAFEQTTSWWANYPTVHLYCSASLLQNNNVITNQIMNKMFYANMFSSPMIDKVLGYGDCRRVVTPNHSCFFEPYITILHQFYGHKHWQATDEIITYSASVVEIAITSCFFDIMRWQLILH